MPTLQGTERRRLAVPDAVDSARAKLIYLYLRMCGNSTLEDLHEDLDISILALYSLLDGLEDQDLVTRQGRFYRLVDDESRRAHPHRA